MHAWSRDDEDVMGPTVTRAASAKPPTPTLKNGNDLRESGYLIAVGSRTARFRRKHRSKIMTIILLLLFLVLLSLVLTMTILYINQKHKKPLPICESKECLRSAANLALSMDLSADPCEDYYQYVCGNWPQEHPRPDAYKSYDWFRDKQSKVYTQVRDFLSKNITNQPKPVQQAKDLYTACLDTETLDKRGLKPVYKIFESVGLPPYPTIVNVTEDLHYDKYTFNWLDTVIKIKIKLGIDVLIGFDIFTDPKNSSIYRLVMGSPEATNPFPSMINEKKHRGSKSIHGHKKPKQDKISIFDIGKRQHTGEAEKDDDDDDKKAEASKLFYADLIKIFIVESGAKLINLSNTEIDQNIFLVANEFYRISEDFYDMDSSNDTDTEDDDAYVDIPEYTVDEIQAHTDMIVESNNGTAEPIWRKYLEGIFNISRVRLDFKRDKILISNPDLKYMSLMAAYLSKMQPVAIELLVWTKVAEVLAIHTTSEVRALYRKAYEAMGRPSHATTRSLQCASAVNDQMGLAVSYAIVEPHFINVTKPKIETMLNEMKNALARLVGKAKWMDDDTKLATYQKIIEMRTLVGYPNWLFKKGYIEDYYDGVEVDIRLHLENMINIIQVKIKKALDKFRRGNSYTWATDPTEVNAYHTFQENTITVPLVMIQYPFFDLGLDSLNYGSLGTVLGHEITHGFDNFGRQFDKNGNMLPWWSNATISSFVNMTQCFVDQYSAYYVPEVDEHVNGKRTLGENIADNGGLREAYMALQEHLHKHGPEPKLPGFETMTSEQLFFLSYGNLWCGVNTKASLKSDLEDEHSPQQFRARGSLQNSAEFARAWHCPPGSPMNPEKRCIIF
ncbi:endothelin-converting enzyme 2 [Aricia agestis]|uniref:endothelin-converting enzyme 2 n=1 Tax=Aricia agestis TaxID=91739 RepID=UPI001C2025CA|nr:endothelin-converting enzyme 2 [Aricia agestis]